MKQVVAKIVRGALPALLMLAGGCLSQAPYDQLTRWPAADSGTFPAYHLRKQGDMAAGMLADSGQAVIVDGLYYYAGRPDGALYQLRSTEPLASGWSVRFRPDLVEHQEAGLSLERLEARLSLAVPDPALACAWRLAGSFSEVRLESGAALQRLTGYLFGFRRPATDRVAPLELYFTSFDWLNGGRVADFTLIEGSLAIDLCPRYQQVYTATSQAAQQLRR